MGSLLNQPRLPFSSHCTLKTTSPHHSSLLPLTSMRSSSPRSRGRGFGVAAPDDKQKKAEKNEIVKKEEEDEIPEEVFDRITKRILLYIGAPMATGIGMLYVLSLLKENGIWEVPVWLPFLIILVSFGTLGLGVAYGILSTSWDQEDEGSVLGWEEVKKNWPEIWKEEVKG